jgi:hypothetical protein
MTRVLGVLLCLSAVFLNYTTGLLLMITTPGTPAPIALKFVPLGIAVVNFLAGTLLLNRRNYMLHLGVVLIASAAMVAFFQTSIFILLFSQHPATVQSRAQWEHFIGSPIPASLFAFWVFVLGVFSLRQWRKRNPEHASLG